MENGSQNADTLNPDLEIGKNEIRENGENPTGLGTTELQNGSITTSEYDPISEACETLGVMVPTNMRYEMYSAVEKIDREVNGVDRYVMEKLKYKSQAIFCKAFAREQVDAIAVAIYNIERKGQALIVGDATGIGKGRIAAALIRYAALTKRIPFFMTEKPNLFSDIYRDLIATGSDSNIPMEYFAGEEERKKTFTTTEIINTIKEDIENGDYDLSYNPETLFNKENEKSLKSAITEYRELLLEEGETEKITRYTKNKNYEADYKKDKGLKPFIINNPGRKTDIVNSNRDILYKGSSKSIDFMKQGMIPADCKVVLSTYSQFSSLRETVKKTFLKTIASKCIFILDESHNASGSSNTGTFLRQVLGASQGALFLSATYAKTPDNIPIYASKTSIGDAGLTDIELIDAINAGGVALQEVISAQLVAEGQMMRREHSYQGVKVEYIYLDDSQDLTNPQFNQEEEHKAIADRITEIIREVMLFQEKQVNPIIENMDLIAAAEQGTVETRQGLFKAGVDNAPIFSGIFNLINQMLFSIKAKSVAEMAVEEMKNGRKPIIAFASTMESFLDHMTNSDGSMVEIGDMVKHDFTMVLRRRLDSVLKYTIERADGTTEKKSLDINEQDEEFKNQYLEILNKIQVSSFGISISPIDVIIDVITKAGFTVEEATGRNRKLRYVNESESQIIRRNPVKVNEAFLKFNDNDIDCLLINQSAATGASAHAIVTPKVTIVPNSIPNSLEPRNEVKQRVMLILQAELDINKEVQKRGRIFRTGQKFLPEYKYVSSAIPAEKRLMMMLQKKLKSLDANTSSNQKQSSNILSTVDFLNKIGDRLVEEYLKGHKELNDLLDDPIKIRGLKDDEHSQAPDKAHKVTGRVAILATEEQQAFYTEITESYISEEILLKQTGEYDLEVESLNLEAKTLDREPAMVPASNAGNSVFNRLAVLEKCEVNVLRKPYKSNELKTLIQQSLTINGKPGSKSSGMSITPAKLRDKMLDELKAFYEARKKHTESEIRVFYKELKDDVHNEHGLKRLTSDADRQDFIQSRFRELESAMEKALESNEIRLENVYNSTYRYFNYFTVGKSVGYPGISYKTDHNWYKAVFIGFAINLNARNPYALSNIKARFAIASSEKYVAMPLSRMDDLHTMEAITRSNISADENFIDKWDELISAYAKNRNTRYIITGNILLAMSKPEYSSGGRLVSYTVLPHGVKKGILLPEGFSTDRKGRDQKPWKITVPIIKALPIIKSMSDGAVTMTNQGLTIQKISSGYNIALLKLRGTDIKTLQKDSIFMAFMEDKEFVLKSGEFRNNIEFGKIDNLVEYLQQEYKMSVDLSKSQFEQIKDQFPMEEYSDEIIDPNRQNEVIDELTKTDNEIKEMEEISESIETGRLNLEQEIAQNELLASADLATQQNDSIEKFMTLFSMLNHSEK